MVGHFLQPNRKSRSGSSNQSNGHAAHSASPPVSGAAAVGSSMAYSPHSAMSPSSRYSQPQAPYDAPSMAYMPPQNLTAEAVAALPPPGMFFGLQTSSLCLVLKTHPCLFDCFILFFNLSMLRLIWSFCSRIQSQKQL